MRWWTHHPHLDQNPKVYAKRVDRLHLVVASARRLLQALIQHQGIVLSYTIRGSGIYGKTQAKTMVTKMILQDPNDQNGQGRRSS